MLFGISIELYMKRGCYLMLETKRNRKACRLLVVGFDGKTVPSNVKKLIQDYHIGGIILFSKNGITN